MRSSMAQAPRILLLTSGLGTGHSRAMQSIEQALLLQSPHCATRTVDFWSLINPEVGKAIQQTYLRLVTEQPGLYQRLYQLDQHSWRNILERGAPLPELIHELRDFLVQPAEPSLRKAERHWFDRLLFRQLLILLARDSSSTGTEVPFHGFWKQAAVHRSWALLTRRLQRMVEGFAPDVVIATQVNMAALAARLKKQGKLRAPLMGVITDFGVHDFWLQSPINAYCVPDESMRASLQQPSNPVVAVTGMPLSTDFVQPPQLAQARHELDLPQDRPVVLLLGGGLGLGIEATLERLLASLPPDNAPLLVVMAGRNQDLRHSLQRSTLTRAALSRDAIRIQGWTDQVATFISAADLVVGKPGGLTTAEVLACGRPLFSTCSLGGQESFNVAYLASHGVGELLEESRLAQRIVTLFADTPALRRMQAKAWELGKRGGAALVAECALRELQPARAARAGPATRQRAG